ncbi:hypothetical protein F8388_019989 [Cannabis sativa]|uniref:Uncharacterized protein n=1 Tax=Cannabis sativa TaxID=3483 RepID=A0A7J6GTT2_CANSA|nr:hypothetical protein F8388_019989 [Cannabis sativa]
MFPSNTWNIGNDPISFSHDQSLIPNTSKPCLLSDIVVNTNTSTPNSKQPFFYFPSSPLFEDENLFLHNNQNNYDGLLLLPHLNNTTTTTTTTTTTNILSTSSTDKAAHVGVSAEPNNNNNEDPMNLTNDLHHYHNHQKEDLSELRKNHIARYDGDGDGDGDGDDDDNNDGDQQKLIPRKKMTAKKDRHSKIMMSAGKRPRHRRMRLSLDVARQFFDLQDMLGYERASKTVEWLLIQARLEIKKLARKTSTTTTLAAGLEKIANSSTNSGTNSDCEVVSGLDEVAVVDHGDTSKSLVNKETKKRQIVSRPRWGLKLPRESRDKARERARERTKQKHMRGKRALLAAVVDHHCQHGNNQDLISHGLRTSWSLETGEEESGTHSGQNINSFEGLVLQANYHEFEEPLTTWHHNGHQEQYRNTCTPAALPNLADECSFLNVGKCYWSSSPIFNYLQTTATSESTGSIPQEVSFTTLSYS